MHVPPNAAKRHFAVEAVGGFDALLALVAPRSLFRRVLAVKLLRAWGELPKDTSVLAALVGTVREFAPHTISFMYEGEMFEIEDSRGRTRAIPREVPSAPEPEPDALDTHR